MTPREFLTHINAWRERDKRRYDWEMERSAWLAAVLINHFPTFGKRRPRAIQPKDLLRREERFTSKEDFLDAVRKRATEREAEDEIDYVGAVW